MDISVSTLLHPFETDRLEWLSDGQKALFLNAQYHPALSRFKALIAQQYFKPHADILVMNDVAVEADIPSEGMFDVVMIALPKNRVEAEYFIARGLKCLAAGGILMCAAENKAGGSRIQKMLHQFGVTDFSDTSKNKARVCWGRVDQFDEHAVQVAFKAGEQQEILDGDYISQPGMFGWNKVDQGSKILMQHLPNDLKGHGGDFGCGYGYLGRYIVAQCPKAKSLISLDADYRAVQCARDNVSKNAADLDLKFEWSDLTHDGHGVKNLDFIVMNPPFHEGKKTDISLGISFIRESHRALRRKGVLWMVANVHLPYEQVLNDLFFNVEKKYEGEGFKIYAAYK